MRKKTIVKSTKATPHLPIPICLLRSEKAKHVDVSLLRIPQRCNRKRVGRARSVRQRVGRVHAHACISQRQQCDRAVGAISW